MTYNFVYSDKLIFSYLLNMRLKIYIYNLFKCFLSRNKAIKTGTPCHCLAMGIKGFIVKMLLGLRAKERIKAIAYSRLRR